MKELPPIIHLIWIGRFPEKYQNHLVNFCRSAAVNGWRVRLYVNEPFVAGEYSSQFAGTLALPLKNLSVQNIDDVLNDIYQKCPELRRLWPQIMQIMKMEQSGAYYNYASSSDLLRILLVYSYGGVYSDFDAYPLRAFPRPDELHSEVEPTQDILANPETGNAFIAAAPKCPILFSVISDMVNSYSLKISSEGHFRHEHTTPGKSQLDKKRTCYKNWKLAPSVTNNIRGISVAWGPGILQDTIKKHAACNGIDPKCFMIKVSRRPNGNPYSLKAPIGKVDSFGELICFCDNNWLLPDHRPSTTDDLVHPHRGRSPRCVSTKEAAIMTEHKQYMDRIADADATVQNFVRLQLNFPYASREEYILLVDAVTVLEQRILDVRRFLIKAGITSTDYPSIFWPPRQQQVTEIIAEYRQLELPGPQSSPSVSVVSQPPHAPGKGKAVGEASNFGAASSENLSAGVQSSKKPPAVSVSSQKAVGGNDRGGTMTVAPVEHISELVTTKTEKGKIADYGLDTDAEYLAVQTRPSFFQRHKKAFKMAGIGLLVAFVVAGAVALLFLTCGISLIASLPWWAPPLITGVAAGGATGTSLSAGLTPFSARKKSREQSQPDVRVQIQRPQQIEKRVGEPVLVEQNTGEGQESHEGNPEVSATGYTM